MVFFDLLLLAFIILILVGGVTQIILPIMNNTPLFPILMHDHNDLESELAKAKHVAENVALKQEIKRTKKQSHKNERGN